jgi:hypothetical protein
VFPRLIRYIEKGQLAPVVYQTFSLAKTREAQTLFMQKRHVGKIVLTIQAASGTHFKKPVEAVSKPLPTNSPNTMTAGFWLIAVLFL